MDILQGAKFKWLTDHKGLTHLLNQKNLSGRQARWLEKISAFTFEVVYIAGSENVVVDALSRIYSNDSGGTVRTKSEYTYHDVVDDGTANVGHQPDVLPVLAGIEARIVTRRGSRVQRPSQKAVMVAEEPVVDRTIPRIPVRARAVESSSGLAARTKSRFVLKGPRPPAETTEGGYGSNQPQPAVENIISDDIPVTTQLPTSVAPIETPLPAEGTLLDVVSQSLQGLDLPNELRGQYILDPMFKSLLEQPKDFSNFEVNEQLIYLKDLEKRVLCIPKVVIRGRSVREIVISEAHSILVHLGASKTIDYL